MKGKIYMRYDKDFSIQDAGHKLVYLKDRSKKSKPGKFSARSKADKPKPRLGHPGRDLQERIDQRCGSGKASHCSGTLFTFEG